MSKNIIVADQDSVGLEAGEGVSLGGNTVDSLQSELVTLEKVYVRVNLRIEFGESLWTRALWEDAEAMLDRMGTVLRLLGHQETHQDCLLIEQLRVRNTEKYQRWLMSDRVLRRDEA